MAEPSFNFREADPTDEACFRVAEPIYDKGQTCCDPGWQSQPSIDHYLCSKHLETMKLKTSTYKDSLYWNNNITKEHLYLA